MNNICKQCNKGFNEWEYTSNCTGCDDGIAENERNPFMYEAYALCRKCNGTGEIKAHRKDFCSEECIDGFFTNEYSKL